MKKGYLLGGLAVVGAIALFAYLKPKAPRRNSEGFFGANGRMSRGVSDCFLCSQRDVNNREEYTYAENGSCPRGYRCRVTQRQQAIMDAQR